MLPNDVNPPSRRVPAPKGDKVKGALPLLDLYVGLDLSLTGSGVCRFHRSHVDTQLWSAGKKLRGAERLHTLATMLERYVSDGPVKLIGIEGYSFGSRNGGERIGEWGGVARVILFRHGIEFIEIAPNQVKKFVTGKGSGPKAVVMKELFKRFGVDRDDDNEADAAVIAIMTACVDNDAAMENLTKPQLDVVKELRKARAS